MANKKHIKKADWKILDPDSAYQAVCQLNAFDSEKSGHHFGNVLLFDKKPEHSQSISDNPNAWFSGLPWNFDEVYTNIEDILIALGFQATRRDNNLVTIDNFNGQIRDEHIFLKTIAPFSENGSYFLWVGKNGETWYEKVVNGTFMSDLPDRLVLGKKASKS